MRTQSRIGNIAHYALGVLLIVLALNAFGGGYYGLAGAENVPVEWLEGSPFPDYFIPSLFLFVVIGGLSTFAAIAVFRRRKYAYRLAIICGIVVLSWIAIQLLIIGSVSWMQPATAIAASLIILLASIAVRPQRRGIDRN